MPRAILFSIAALVVAARTGAAAGAATDDPRPDESMSPPADVSGFTYKRARKGPQGQLNWVRGYVTLRIAQGADVEDVRVSVDYVDYAGRALASAGPESLGDMKAGEVRETELSQFSVPSFNGYVVTAECRHDGRFRKYKFYGSRTTAAPFYVSPRPYPRVIRPVVMAHELERGFKSRGADLYVRVRNLGAVTTKELHATVRLLDDKGNPRRGSGGKVRTILSGARGGRKGEVRGGEERLFVVKFRSFPQFKNYDVTLDWQTPPAEKLLSGGEFTGAAEVELAYFEFRRNGQNGLEISGRARNGLATDIFDLKVKLALYLKPKFGDTSDGVEPRLVKTIEGDVPGVIRASAAEPFAFTAQGVGEYNDFDYEVAYSEPGGASVAATTGPAPGAQPVVTVESAVMKGGTTLMIAGDVRNAAPVPIRDFRLTFHLNRNAGGREETVAEIAHEIPGVIGPGESVPFIVSKKDCPKFDRYLYETTFKPLQ